MSTFKIYSLFNFQICNTIIKYWLFYPVWWPMLLFKIFSTYTFDITIEYKGRQYLLSFFLSFFLFYNQLCSTGKHRLSIVGNMIFLHSFNLNSFSSMMKWEWKKDKDIQKKCRRMEQRLSRLKGTEKVVWTMDDRT